MEIFNKNHPRFCAQYVQEIGVGQEERIGWCRAIKFNDKFFIYQGINRSHEVNDTILIAKRIPLPGKQWTIHKVKLGEDFWNYQYFLNRSAKEQRITPYEPKAQRSIGRNTFIVEEASIEYIKRTFGY